MVEPNVLSGAGSWAMKAVFGPARGRGKAGRGCGLSRRPVSGIFRRRGGALTEIAPDVKKTGSQKVSRGKSASGAHIVSAGPQTRDGREPSTIAIRASRRRAGRVWFSRKTGPWPGGRRTRPAGRSSPEGGDESFRICAERCDPRPNGKRRTSFPDFSKRPGSASTPETRTSARLSSEPTE